MKRIMTRGWYFRFAVNIAGFVAFVIGLLRMWLKN
jgi:hypothetical protein